MIVLTLTSVSELDVQMVVMDLVRRGCNASLLRPEGLGRRSLKLLNDRGRKLAQFGWETNHEHMQVCSSACQNRDTAYGIVVRHQPARGAESFGTGGRLELDNPFTLIGQPV
jgi:hypothetical protein